MRLFQLLLFSFCLQSLCAQDGMEDKVPAFRPTIMVIPFVKEGEQLRTVYELDEMLNLRIAVTKLKDALALNDIPTVDFRAKIKQLQMDENMTIGNQSSIKQRVIELSGADIYVEVEAAVIPDVDGSAVTVTATAYDAFGGQVLASDVATTPKYYTYNFEKLTQRAVNAFFGNFIESIQYSFDRIIEEGRMVSVDIGFTENAAIDMDTEMEDGRLFSEFLESWFEENAYRGHFHVQGVTATKLILDEVRIPVKEESGRNYRVTKFAAKLRSTLVKQGFNVTRDVVGSKIFITID